MLWIVYCIEESNCGVWLQQTFDCRVLYASYREFTPCLNWNKLKQMYVNDTQNKTTKPIEITHAPGVKLEFYSIETQGSKLLVSKVTVRTWHSLNDA